MKRSALLLAALALATMFAGSLAVSSASHCGSAANNAHDPFGSCETTGNQVSCGGTELPGNLAHVNATPSSGNGVQACNDNGPIPPYGRATVYTNGGNVLVGVDGDADQPGTQGWTRADVRTSGSDCKAQLRRGSTGSYYASGGGTSNPDVFDSKAIGICP